MKRIISTILMAGMFFTGCAEEYPINITVEKDVIESEDDVPGGSISGTWPCLLLKAEDKEIYRQHYEAMPDNASKRNKMVKAWFSDVEADREAATEDFIEYYKNYAQRWTPEALVGSDNGVALRGVWRSIHLYDVVKSFGYLTRLQEEEFKSTLVTAIKGAVGDDSKNPFIPETSIREKNIYTDVFLAAGLVGLVFPDLEESQDWVDYALSELEWQLDHCIWDDCCWLESPRYHIYTMKCMGQFMEIYKNVTGEDLFQREEFKNLARWCILFNSPADKMAGKNAGMPEGARLLPGIGDTAWGEEISPINIFARHYTETDPELAAQLMWIYEQSGRGYSAEPVLDLLVDQNLPSTPPASLGSEICPTKGYISMRTGFNTEDEVWMMLKSGTHSWHEHPDKGSFSLIAYGTPFVLDAGSANYNDPLHRSWHKTSSSHSMVNFRNDGVTDIYSYRSQGGSLDGTVEYWESDDDVDYAVTDATETSREKLCKREVIFVKPDYFIIRDEVEVNSGRESLWMMSSPCDEFVWGDHSILCRNTELGTSMQVHVVTPETPLVQKEWPNMHFGTWWEGEDENNVSLYPMKYLTTLEFPGPDSGEIITVLHPMKAGMSPLTVTNDNGTLKIALDGRNDEVTFTGTGATVKKGGKTIELTIK